MAVSIRAVEYYYVTVKDVPGMACNFLARLEAAEVNLYAFVIVPAGLEATQLTVFPEQPAELVAVAEKEKLSVVGPHNAFLIQGDDELGALVDCHQKLAEANINVYASSGVADGKSGFGYVMHVREGDFAKAKATLSIA